MNFKFRRIEGLDQIFQLQGLASFIEQIRSFLRDSLRKSFLLYWAALFFVQAVVTPSAVGFNFSPPKLPLILLQIVFVLLVVSMLPRKLSRVREILPVLTAIFLTIPIISITFTNNGLVNLRISLLALFYAMFNQVLISVLISFIPSVRIFHERKGVSYHGIAMIIILFAGMVSLYAVYNGLSKIEFSSFSNIYSVRENFSNQLIQINDPLLGHLIGWLGAFLPPVLFLVAIKTRNYIFGFTSFILTILIYSVAGQKWVIALMGLTLVFYLIGRPLSLQEFLPAHKVVDGINLLFALSLFSQLVFYNSGIVNLVIRRTFLDPAIMLQFYTRYSLEFPMGLWRESKIADVLTGDQTPPISNFIGDHYFNIPTRFYLPKFTQMNGTAGTLADSVAQAGIIGLILMTFLVVFFFIMIEVLSFERNKRMVFVISSLSLIGLFEGTLLTMLLSRGLVLIPLILLMLPKDKRLSEV